MLFCYWLSGFERSNPLPPPKNVAELLKQESLKNIQSWNETYGTDYKKLSLGFNFLKNHKDVSELLQSNFVIIYISGHFIIIQLSFAISTRGL